MRWIAPVCVTPLILAATVALGNGAEGAVTSYDNSEPPLEQAAEHPAEVTIHGSVTSSSGARLEGAAVSLAGNTTGATHRVFSGAMGMFRVTGLEAGIYQIHAELTGFETASIPLVLEPGRSQQVHITLQQAFTIENQITVIGSAPASSLEFAEIRESLARDLGEALTKKAGVWQVRKGGIANDVVLRGFQGRDLNILIDGHYGRYAHARQQSGTPVPRLDVRV